MRHHVGCDTAAIVRHPDRDARVALFGGYGNRAAGTAFLLFWTAAIMVTVVGLVALGPLLSLLGAVGDTRGLAREYAVVILAGAIVSTGFSSLVRAEGRMRALAAGFDRYLVKPVASQTLLDLVSGQRGG